MSDRDMAIIAEMMTKETAAERREVWEHHQKERYEMQKFICEHDNRQIARCRRQEAAFRALPWWKRIGKSEYDMPGDA